MDSNAAGLLQCSQRHMYSALYPYIGSICHVYLDDIIIWSQSVKEHIANVHAILDVLPAHGLYASSKKTKLCSLEIDFLGHCIYAKAIEADPRKCEKVLEWPIPSSAGDIREFLRIVRSKDKFLPHLAQFTEMLTPLTANEAQKVWPGPTSTLQATFNAIKKLIMSRECLTVVGHKNMGNNKPEGVVAGPP